MGSSPYGAGGIGFGCCSVLPDFRKWRNSVQGLLCTKLDGPDTTVSRCKLTTLNMCPKGNFEKSGPGESAQAYLKPQSSHSRTGFHPSLLVHKSHFATSSPLLKNNSSGFQPTTSVLPIPVGETVPLPLLRLGLAPGLISVNRCTSGAV